MSPNPESFALPEGPQPSHTVRVVIYLSISLNPGRVQHYTDSVSNGLSRKVASEFSTNRATVSMSTSDLSPDDSGFVWLTTRSHCCFLLWTHKHVSFLDRIQFHLEHKHLQF